MAYMRREVRPAKSNDMHPYFLEDVRMLSVRSSIKTTKVFDEQFVFCRRLNFRKRFPREAQRG